MDAMVRGGSGDGTPSIADVSDDVLVTVFLKMDPIDLGSCLRTCKNWRRLICDGALDNAYWWNKARADLDLLDEDGKLPLQGRRVCDVVASRWLRRRETYALLDGCKAEVVASARGDDGEGRKPLVPLRLREWVKTPYPRWLEQPARVDNEDIALFYRASMREIREQHPTNAHVTDFVEVEWLADLAVMMGERRAMATFAEAMNDPDFHVRGHARCVELVERCAAALSGLIDPYLAGRHQRMWGPTPPSHVSSRVENPGALHPSEKWLWVMREDFRSFGSDLRPKKPSLPEESVVDALDRMGEEFKRRLDSSRIDPRDDPKGALRVLTEFMCGVYPGLDAPGDNPGSTHVADMDFREMPPATHELNPHLLHPKFAMPTEGGLGFRGAGSTVTHDYYDPMCSSLFCVLHARVGIPITLSIVMASVASRAGLKVEFLNVPGHFRCGVRDENYVDPEKPGTKSRPAKARHVVFTSDPFEGFEATDPRKLRTIDWDRMEEEAGRGGRVEELVPSARDVVTRMLNNLLLIYHTHESGGSGSPDGPDLETYPNDLYEEKYVGLPPHRWLVRHAVVALAGLLVSPGRHATFIQQTSARLKLWLPRSAHRLFM